MTAYVTGGSSGIGMAIARALARQGFDVALLARSQQRLDAAVRTIREESGAYARVATVSVDVSDAESVDRAFDRLISEFGTPSVVIHAAGIAYPDYFLRIPESMVDATVRTNLSGSWNVLRAAVAAMRSVDSPPVGAGLPRTAASPLARAVARGRRFIVPVSSMAGLIPVFGYTAYGMSKFGVTGMALALRQETAADGISVSVVCPPDVDTPQLVQEAATKPPETAAVGGNGKPMSPETVANEVLRRLPRNPALIIPGFGARLDYFAYRVAPRVVEKILFQRIRSVTGRI